LVDPIGLDGDSSVSAVREVSAAHKQYAWIIFMADDTINRFGCKRTEIELKQIWLDDVACRH
jgi:hypothetical protein